MTLTADMHHHLLSADLYRLLALSFDEPSPENIVALQEILPSMPADEKGGMEAALQKEHLALAPEYNRLFVNQVVCPSCEGSYLVVERGPIIGDIAAFYEAFQLKVVPCQGPPDAIKMELGFLSYLSLKIAYAEEQGNEERAEVSAAALRQFLLDHLGRWAGPFADRVLHASELIFYREAALLLKKWIERECAFYRLKPYVVPIPLMSFESKGELKCHLS